MTNFASVLCGQVVFDDWCLVLVGFLVVCGYMQDFWYMILWLDVERREEIARVWCSWVF